VELPVKPVNVFERSTAAEARDAVESSTNVAVDHDNKFLRIISEFSR
jgi:hypothetical protein